MTHIAVVDDNDLVRDLVGDVLEDKGYRISGFSSLGPARTSLLASAPDLAIVDVRLGSECGLDLVEELRRTWAELPIMILSGLGGEEDVQRGFEAGANDYLTKPICVGELTAKCSRLLSRAGRSTTGKFADDLPGGQLAFDRYQIEGVAGQGASSLVYSARDTHQAGHTVALKILAPLLSGEAEDRQRFLREAYTLTLLDHPNVVRVHDFGSAEGRFYYAMELIPGPTLAEKVRADGPASEEELISLLQGLGNALAALEAADLIHRDLKPQNVILRDGRYDQPVLIDFGLAKRPYDRLVTRATQCVGTPAYASPEAIQCASVDQRSDLFSLGLTVCFAATGQDTYPDLDGLQLLLALSEQEVEIPYGLSTETRAVLRRLTRLEREDRYQSASELLLALERSHQTPLLAAAS